jgi:hypothetical protein
LPAPLTFAKRIRVRIEQRHIDIGVMGVPSRCALSVAIQEKLGLPYMDVFVGGAPHKADKSGHTDIFGNAGQLGTYRHSQRLDRWLRKFDDELPVRPITVVLTLETIYGLGGGLNYRPIDAVA